MTSNDYKNKLALASGPAVRGARLHGNTVRAAAISKAIHFNTRS